MTRQGQKFSVISGAILLTVAGGVILNRSRSTDHYGRTSGEGPAVQAQEEARQSGGRRDSSLRRGPDPDAAPDAATRIAEMRRLEGRWLAMEVQASQNVVTKEMRDLARESAETLLCSPETFRLLESMERSGLNGGRLALRLAVEELFKSDRADDARGTLADVSHSVTDPTRELVEEWCRLAGATCPETEFDGFLRSLGDEGATLGAALGRNEHLARTEPARAISATLGLLGSTASNTVSGHALLVVVNKIPPDADYPALMELLPPHSAKDVPDQVHGARKELLKKWAGRDPAGAANHVMENPDQVDPASIKVITETVLSTNYSGGLQWVKTFPQGPYQDSAAAAAIGRTYLSNPDVAMEYVTLIQDAKLREKLTARIRSAREAVENGEFDRMEGE